MSLTLYTPQGLTPPRRTPRDRRTPLDCCSRRRSMRRARRNFLCLFAALCISALAEDDVEEENRVLKLRLQALQQELAKEGD